jgi:glycosyltransferase involved in cell wall biosynthesis
VIAVSEHIRQYTLKNYPGASPEDIVTIHGGASRELFPFAYQPESGWRQQVVQEFPELRDRRWLCLPGRVTRWKGHADFIMLVARLASVQPDIHGVCVGGCRPGSRYQAELESLAQQHDVLDRITFTGNRLDMRDWMAASEMVFNLSNDPPEAFGRTVLEALCLGQPVVAWNHGGAREILASMFPDGAIPPMDQAALFSRARHFLAEPPTVAASDAFSLTGSMQKTVDVYNALMESQPK